MSKPFSVRTHRLRIRWLGLVCVTAGLVTTPAGHAIAGEREVHRIPPIERQHIEALRQGGHVIFLRHAQREHGIPGMELIDLAPHVPGLEPPADDMPGHCLTRAGKESARVLGRMFARLRIPVGRVYSSPICRAVQTAELAFNRVDKKVEVLSFVHHNYGDEAVVRRHGERLRQFFRAHRRDDTNIVVSAHGNMLSPLGVEYDDLEELGFLIFDRDLKVIARANPGELAALIYDMEVPEDATRDGLAD